MRRLAVITIGFAAALLVGFTAGAPAQVIAPGPASPDPRPYGVSPGGTPMAPGPAGRSTSPSTPGTSRVTTPITTEQVRGKKAGAVNRCLRRCARIKSPRQASRCRRACR